MIYKYSLTESATHPSHITHRWLIVISFMGTANGRMRFRKLLLRTFSHKRAPPNRNSLPGHLHLLPIYFWSEEEDADFILFLLFERWALINVKCMRKLHSNLQENAWKENWASIPINSHTMDVHPRILCTSKWSVWYLQIISKFKDDFTSGRFGLCTMRS